MPSFYPSSCRCQGPLFGCVVPRRARGVKKGVHYIAFSVVTGENRPFHAPSAAKTMLWSGNKAQGSAGEGGE